MNNFKVYIVLIYSEMEQWTSSKLGKEYIKAVYCYPAYLPLCRVQLLSCVRLFATPWTVAYQAPLSMGFSRQEYWSGFPLPGDLPDPGIEFGSPAL